MGFEVITGSALEVLQSLEAGSAQTCVTSPPYFGLRDYGTAKWEGGLDDCDHARFLGGNGQASAKQVTSAGTQKYQYRGVCGKCGATRADNQIGLEETPELFVQRLVEVFREVRRVLRDDGTLWLNIGDSYWGGKGENGSSKARATAKERGFIQSGGTVQMSKRPQDGTHPEIKPKDLVGVPWMLAFALRADGWYLRSDIIWHKPNVMPESVTDRPTKAHEYVFLLSKCRDYYYDAESVKERASMDSGFAKQRLKGRANWSKATQHKNGRASRGLVSGNEGENRVWPDNGFRNRRSVWMVSTKPFKGAHFATFPEKLIEPCILAGSREGDTVIDPFSGAGTSGVVAMKHGRDFIGIELNPDYAEMSRKRIDEVLESQPLLAVTKGNGTPVVADAPLILPEQADSRPPGVTFGNNGSVAHGAEVVQA